MKIAMFTDTYYPQKNGIVFSIDEIAKNLAREGHEVDIFSPGEGENNGQVNTYKYPSVSFRNYTEYRIVPPVPFFKAMKITKKKKYDIIHSHTPFTMGAKAYMLSKMFSIPLIGSYHTLLSEYVDFSFKGFKSKWFAWFWSRWYSYRCQSTIVPSESVKEMVVKNGFKKPVHVVPNGIYPEKFKNGDINYAKKRYNTDKKIIIFLGRLSWEKRVDDLLKACKNMEGVMLVICGDGPSKDYLKKLAKKEGLDAKFPGYVSGQKLVDFLSSADLFAFPSIGDTQGLVLLEAMASGTPIVSVRSQGIVDIVRHNENGLLSKPKNPEALRKNIESILGNKKLRDKLVKNGYKKTVEYDWRKIIKKFIRVYNKYS